MGLLNKIRKKKYIRYELQVNDGGGWKKFGEYSEFLDYNDIENPDPGVLLSLYGVYVDSSRKEGFGKKRLWLESVPVPGDSKTTAGKKEKPIEERLMEKIVEGADFTGLKPTKMSLPFGKSGGTLDFESPVHIPGGEDGRGYMVIDGNRYPTGEIPPLEFEGKLPAWMHPAAGAMIMGLVDKFGGMLKSSIGGAISQATGIKAKESTEEVTKKEGKVEEPIGKPPDLVEDIDKLLAEGEEENKIDVKKKKKEKVK